MSLIQGDVLQSGGVPALASGAKNAGLMFDRQNAALVSELNAKYGALSISGRLFFAQAIVAAPVIFTTAAGTGGPLLWNPPGSGVNAQLIAASIGVTVVTTVAAALGITGGTGQNVVPTTTTAIDGSGNCFFGGAAAKVSSFRIGTVGVAGTFLIPFGKLSTGALTVDNTGIALVDLGGLFTFGPGGWASVSVSATATTTAATIGLLWVELPIS